MLTKTQREYVGKKGKREQYTKSNQRIYNSRIRRKAKQMLKDLTFLSAHLPESQQKQIFTEENFLPLIKSVIDPNRPHMADEMKRRKERSEQIYVANRRVFSLCNKIIKLASESGAELVPKDIVNLIASSESSLEDAKIVLKIENFISK